MAQSALEKKVWELFTKGLTDNEILKELVTKQGEVLTFMELRVLRADYEAEHPETVAEPPADPAADLDTAPEDAAGGVIQFDAIRKPGAMVSGTANLPSGLKVSWALDQYGRISFAPQGKGRPTPEDMQVFQTELQQEITRRGGIL
ncbi:MAG: hypothetical protein ABIF71_07705 [Planctomycetota bacterium]